MWGDLLILKVFLVFMVLGKFKINFWSYSSDDEFYGF